MRRRIPLVLASLLALPCGARAQGFSASRYLAPTNADDLARTERAWVTPHLRVGAVLVGEYAHRLRTLERAPVFTHRATVHAAVTLGLFDRLQVGLAMPVVLFQESALNAAAPAPGDLRVDARVRVAGLARRGVYRLSLALGAALPTGDAAAWAGDGAVSLTPRLLFEATWARDYVFAANVGTAVRLGWRHQGFARVGVSIPVAARTVITLEGAVEMRLDDPGAPGAVSLETLAGLRHVSRRGLALGVAAGPGAVLGEGTADVRAVLAVGYAPQVDDALHEVGDRDADLVLDPNDRCPDEPAGPRPDPRAPGCPVRDQDRDGVRDDQDECPARPVGDDPDPQRVGCPREDRDRDGVRDPDDVCPLDPAGPHPDPASRGCPHPDPDGDGILNALDACPLERGVASSDRATHGCPRVFVRGDRVVIPQQPRFAVDRDVILPVSMPLLSEVAAALEAHPELTRIEIQGHTDDVGDDPHNMDLSERRARSIRAYLIARGVSADRLEARGYGETVPLVDNRAPGGRAMNRRVEFVVRQRAEPAP